MLRSESRPVLEGLRGTVREKLVPIRPMLVDVVSKVGLADRVKSASVSFISSSSNSATLSGNVVDVGLKVRLGRRIGVGDVVRPVPVMEDVGDWNLSVFDRAGEAVGRSEVTDSGVAESCLLVCGKLA